MKKIFSFVIVLAAVAMVSCGGNATQATAETVEVEATEVVAPAADSTACCAAQADSTACQKAEAECCNK